MVTNSVAILILILHGFDLDINWKTGTVFSDIPECLAILHTGLLNTMGVRLMNRINHMTHVFGTFLGQESREAGGKSSRRTTRGRRGTGLCTHTGVETEEKTCFHPQWSWKTYLFKVKYDVWQFRKTINFCTWEVYS